MLTLFTGKRHGFCDKVDRRDFLRVGALGLGGLTLADLFRAEAVAAPGGKNVGSSHKAVINIFLGGGPSHQDMFDLKPNAPVEYRGEFNPIATNVPGIEICEHMPKLAAMADKFAIIRSIADKINQHSNFQTQTGYSNKDLRGVGGRPAMGSLVARLLGPAGSGAPPFVSYTGTSAGYLGPSYRAYRPGRGNLRLDSRMSAERISDRTGLLVSLDRLRRDVDNTGQMDALDSFTQRAADVVCSGRVADALDTGKEDPKSAQRYGNDGRNFLLARRLVEAGVRVMSFSWGGWDTHGENFDKLRKQLPRLDSYLSALISDLHDRGLEQDVSVVMWGEFGRTPRVNKKAGRDHWSKASFAFLAGGGMRTGQVIGATTKNAEEPADRPIHVQEVFATLYHNLGIDPQTTTLRDPAGRPQFLVDHREPIRELI